MSEAKGYLFDKRYTQFDRTGMYLEPNAGETAIQNMQKMAREGMRSGLSTALHQAVATQASSFAPDTRVKPNGHFVLANVSVQPVATNFPLAADAPATPL